MDDKISKPLISVIIPTRERADTLIHCLRTVVAQDYENLNIIVSDNFSQDNTREVVASFFDPRIKYINTSKRVSMSHNWEFALGHVTDGWVTFLGDDDGLLPGGLAKVAQVISDTGCLAVTSIPCLYYWPGSTAFENQMIIPIAIGVELRNGMEWLTKLMRGEAPYMDLPWLYHGGFVDLSLINSARDCHGKFFLSMTPDVYSAVALASITGNYVMMKEPVCVEGVSSHSMGASSLGLTKDQGPSQKFYSEENIPFHSKLGSGRVKSSPIIVYECYLQAMHLHHDVLRVDMTDQLALALRLSMPQYYGEIRNYCDEVAHRNGIDIKNIEKKEHLPKYHLWRKKFGYVRKHWQQVTVDAREFNVKDVYGAAFLSSAIFVFNKQYKNWRWRKFTALLRRQLARFVLSN